MEVKQIRCFSNVAELKSFTLAADRIGMTQSALSRQIMNLERDLGVKLFDRSSRRVKLTPAGDLLQIRARQLIDLTRQIRSEIRGQTTTPSGTVAVGALPSFGNLIFPRLAVRYRRQFPNVQLRFVEALTHELQDRLTRGEIDIALLAFPEPDKTMDTKFLCKENIYLVSGPGNDPGLGASCSFVKAALLPLVLTTLASRERLWYERLAALHGVALNVVIEGNSLMVLKDLASTNAGHLLLPFSAVWNEARLRRWHLTRIRKASVERMMAWRRDRDFTPAITRMVELIEDQTRMLRSEGLVQ